MRVRTRLRARRLHYSTSKFTTGTRCLAHRMAGAALVHLPAALPYSVARLVAVEPASAQFLPRSNS